jgi:ParB family chromosome partitioning protein
MKLASVAPELFQLYRDNEITLECLMAFAVTDDHDRQVKVHQSLPEWQQDDPDAIRDALTEKMVEASSKLVRFVGLETYQAAGGSTHADLFAEETYLEHPALLHQLAEQKFDVIRSELEAEGWGWVEINPERDYALINSCKRLRPQLVNAPSYLLEKQARLEAELEEIGQALDETESDALLDEQNSYQEELNVVEEELAAFVDFDADQKALAGCFVSIGQDGTPFIDKGLVKPEHRKELARLTGENDGAHPTKAKPKHPLSTSLRRDLAAARLEAAQVELAKHPAVAFDLLVFQVASTVLGDPASIDDGAEVRFQIPRQEPADDEERTIAGDAFASLADTLPVEWLQLPSEAARFEAFRSLPDMAKHKLLSYCVARTLKPKLAPTAGEEVTAYDTILSLTSGDVAAYWRPTSENFLGRITRDQLLAIGREVLGETWAHSRAGDKKASLVGQLHRAFATPEKPGRAPEQAEKLKRWLPAGMSFEIEAPSTAETNVAA